MHRFIWYCLLAFATYQTFKSIMSNDAKKDLNLNTEELTKEDLKNFDPDNLILNMGGRQVPFSAINKPHHVVLDAKDHVPIPDTKDFPGLTPEAKARDAERAEAKAALQKTDKAADS